jgi:phosphatidylinositol-3-phosphatase
MRRGLFIGSIVVALVFTACGSSQGVSPATRTVSAPTGAGAKSSPSKILVVIEENHSVGEMRAGMPYLARLSDRYGYATRWHALTHPSEPNYLAIAGGSTFGIANDRPPAENAPLVGRARSVFSQARRAGKTARTYAQSMPQHCMASDAYPYAVKHNPWAFFGADSTSCKRRDVDTSSFGHDARTNRLPNVGFLIPDLQHDAHDGTLGAADTWLRHRLSPVLGSHDFKSGALIVVVTADEDDRSSGNVVLTSVLTPLLHHVVVRKRLTHYSLTRFISGVLGKRAFRGGHHAPNLARAFGL